MASLWAMRLGDVRRREMRACCKIWEVGSTQQQQRVGNIEIKRLALERIHTSGETSRRTKATDKKERPVARIGAVQKKKLPLD